jgi:hypothetical protein
LERAGRMDEMDAFANDLAEQGALKVITVP